MFIIFSLIILCVSIPECSSSISIPSGTTAIDDAAYKNCADLTDLSLSEGLQTIGSESFYNCHNLRGQLKIPDSVVSIGDSAFSECSSLTGLSLGNGVQKIGQFSFYHCASIENQIIFPSSVTELGDSAFSGCSKLNSISINAKITKISKSIFSDCSSLRIELTIPNSVTEIQERAFYRCENLISVNLNKVQIIGDYSFGNCMKMSGLTIPDSVTEIRNYAFHNCKSFSSITIGQRVQMIGNYTFGGCLNIQGELKIPNTVREIGFNSFYDCSKLTSISIGSGIEKISRYSFFFCTGLTGELKIPDTVNEIDDYSFYGCSGLTGISFGSNVQRIGANSFERSSGLSGQLFLPNTVSEIGGYAFYGCAKLTSLKLSTTIKSIGTFTFFNCQGIEGALEIPDLVESIGDYAFYGCVKITSISFGSQINEIGIECFGKCRGLSGSLVIPDTIKTIKRGAFRNCNCIKSLTLNSKVKTIESQTFENCYDLSGQLKIPDIVTNIKELAFFGCKTFTSLVLSKSITNLGEKSFSNCLSLSGNLVIPSTIKKIGSECFSHTNLSLITYEGTTQPGCEQPIFEPRTFYVLVPDGFNDQSFCGFPVIHNPEVPIQTPYPTYYDQKTETEEFKTLVLPEGVNEENFNIELVKLFKRFGNEQEKDKVVIVDFDKIEFSSNLENNQFIRVKNNCEINFNSGDLNLVIPKSEKVTLLLNNQGNEEIKLILKGEGDLKIAFSESEFEKQKSLILPTKSRINGSFSITVPNEIESVSIDSINFEKQSSFSIKKENNQPVVYTIKNVETSKNADATLSNVLITNSLKVPQSSTIRFESVELADETVIQYEFEKYDWNSSIFKGNFNKPPKSFLLNKIQTEEENIESSYNINFSIVTGLFEEGKCNEWLKIIDFGNSQFNFTDCVDNDEDQIQSTESKKIIVKILHINDEPESGGGGLSKGQIAGIVIGCILGVAIIVAVVVLVIVYKKKNSVRISQDEDDINNIGNYV